ncbi:MAG: zinc ABC transporter substrate-binding protein [Paraprevotella sp.]|nr:zinc ABC transporter substrate-binding protein [Paraprevotella sp.]
MDRNGLWPVVFLICAACCIGCTRRATTSEEKRITVSIEPLRYVTERLVGDAYVVHTLVPRGSSPETYEPTPGQMMELSGSELYIACGGLGFEQNWLDRLHSSAPHTIFISAASGIPLLPSEHHHSGKEHADSEAGDPHVWTSPRNMAFMARNICDALCRIDTASAAVYQSNLSDFLSELQIVEGRIGCILKEKQSRAFLIYHPALTYFARDYELKQLAIEADGKEPSASRLQALVDECREIGVRTVFVQKEFDIRHAEVVAREIGARTVEIDPLSYDWEQEMLHIAETL